MLNKNSQNFTYLSNASNKIKPNDQRVEEDSKIVWKVKEAP